MGVLVLVALMTGCTSGKPCPGDSPHNELLGLSPRDPVTFDGVPLQRSANGRYQTDAGHDFDVELVTVEAVDPRTSCFNSAELVTVSLRNPFTGVATTVEAMR